MTRPIPERATDAQRSTPRHEPEVIVAKLRAILAADKNSDHYGQASFVDHTTNSGSSVYVRIQVDCPDEIGLDGLRTYFDEIVGDLWAKVEASLPAGVEIVN